MNILVTGGAGYIGSHTLVELYAAGHTAVVVDNLSNSSEESLRRVEKIVGASIPFIQLNVANRNELDKVFTEHKFDAVMHFAGLKAVGESVQKPLEYYDNNLNSTISLLHEMRKYNVKKLIFSSSATVYGDPGNPKYVETIAVGQKITNPYGQTKYMIEQIIRDVSTADPSLEVSILRYFNPIGAHSSGLIGEDSHSTPNNLMPFIEQVASGRRDTLHIFGNDYPTPDGTCRRDYIHVVDLALGHLAALEHLSTGVTEYNLGSGEPTSILELVNTFIKTTGKNIPYDFAPRRAGDLPEFYADPSKAKAKLGWSVTKTIANACADSWRWQSQNPNGYSAKV